MVSTNKALLVVAFIYVLEAIVISVITYFNNLILSFNPITFMDGAISALLCVFIITNMHKYIKF